MNIINKILDSSLAASLFITIAFLSFWASCGQLVTGQAPATGASEPTPLKLTADSTSRLPKGEFHLTVFGSVSWATHANGQGLRTPNPFGKWNQRTTSVVPFTLNHSMQSTGSVARKLEGIGQNLGHLNLTTLEGALATRCASLRDPSTSLVVHPQTLVDLVRSGFNMIALASDHATDCLKSDDFGQVAADTTLQYANQVQSVFPELVSHGLRNSTDLPTTITNPTTGDLLARKTVLVQGKSVRVAFASLLSGPDSACTQVLCPADYEQASRTMRSLDADLKVVAIHIHPDSARHEKRALENWAPDLIKHKDVDVVVITGEQIAGTTAEATTIKKVGRDESGVIFSGLGDLIHTSKSAEATGDPSVAGKEYGRAIFDLQTLSLRDATTSSLK